MTDKRKPGRPATGRTTVQIRIPAVLEPAVREFIATYERLRWQQPIQRYIQPPEQDLLQERHLDRSH